MRKARGSASISLRRMGGRSSNIQLAASSPARRTMGSYPVSSRRRKLKTARTPDTYTRLAVNPLGLSHDS